jgi:hypothetical protein
MLLLPALPRCVPAVTPHLLSALLKIFQTLWLAIAPLGSQCSYEFLPFVPLHWTDVDWEEKWGMFAPSLKYNSKPKAVFLLRSWSFLLAIST